MITTQY